MAKVRDPFFGTAMRGTLADLLGVRREGSRTTMRATPGPRRNNPAEMLAIRRCFREAKLAHAATPPTEVLIGKRRVWRILPAWPDFWVAWLAAHPECLATLLDPGPATEPLPAGFPLIWMETFDGATLPPALPAGWATEDARWATAASATAGANAPELVWTPAGSLAAPSSVTTPRIDAAGHDRLRLTWRQRLAHNGATPALLRLRASLDGATWTVVHRQAVSGTPGPEVVAVNLDALAHRSFTLSWTVPDPAPGLAAWAIDRIILYNPR
jgi:hypothetical protein